MTSKYDAKLIDFGFFDGPLMDTDSEEYKVMRGAITNALQILDPNSMPLDKQVMSLSGIAAVLIGYVHMVSEIPVADLLTTVSTCIADVLGEDQKLHAENAGLAFYQLVSKLADTRKPVA